jgi:amino acid transporter
MSRKEIVLALVLPVVFTMLGLIPMFFEKAGYPVPGWLISTGVCVTILSVCLLLFFVFAWILSKFGKLKEQSVPLNDAIPLIVFAVLAVGVIVFYFSASPKYDVSSTKDVVMNQTFFEKDVELDGKSFVNCKFIRVNFIFRGRKSFSLTNSTIEGQVGLEFNEGSQLDTAVMVAHFVEGALRDNPKALEELSRLGLFPIRH